MRILFCLIIVFFSLQVTAQQTYVPDDNFEQGLIDLGYDNPPLDDFVPTSAIESITSLFLENKSIVDMTGIEDFVGLNLIDLTGNFIEDLDLSQNINLERIDVYNNNLNTLNIKNGNLYNILSFNAQLNPNLTCIDVDDVSYANANLLFIDSQTHFSENNKSFSLASSPNLIFSFYPNPTANELYIENEKVDIQQVEIYNLSGKKVLRVDYQNNQPIDVSNLAKGMYLVKIKTEIGNVTKKLIKD